MLLLCSNRHWIVIFIITWLWRCSWKAYAVCKLICWRGTRRWMLFLWSSCHFLGESEELSWWISECNSRMVSPLFHFFVLAWEASFSSLPIIASVLILHSCDLWALAHMWRTFCLEMEGMQAAETMLMHQPWFFCASLCSLWTRRKGCKPQRLH